MNSIKEIQDKYIIFALIVLQLIVTLPFINSFPIDLDEPFSIFYAQQDLSDLIPYLNSGNNPPLHFILLHFWIKMFGISPIAVRSLSLLFSILTIPVLYNFAKKIIKKEFAILTVCFFIFSNLIHYHSIEARTYSLFIFLTLLTYNELFNIIFNKEFKVIRFGLINALLLYTHYLSFYILFTEIIVLAIFTINQYKTYMYFGIKACMLTIIIYLPGIWIAYIRLSHFSSNGTWVSEPSWNELYGVIIKFFNKPFVFIVFLGLVLFFVFIKQVKLKKRLSFNRKELYIFAVFFISYFGLFFISILLQPVFLPRYLVFLTPIFYILLTIIIYKVLEVPFSSYFAFLFVVPFVLSVNYVPHINREGDMIPLFIEETNKKMEKPFIIIYPPNYGLTFMYYYDREIFKNTSKYNTLLKQSNIYPVYNIGEIPKDSLKNELYFLDLNSKFSYPNNIFLDELLKQYQIDTTQIFKGDYKAYKLLK
jgi:4-amino-4-deoxy-L-arabinose transferase-like glycosyltransferase